MDPFIFHDLVAVLEMIVVPGNMQIKSCQVMIVKFSKMLFSLTTQKTVQSLNNNSDSSSGLPG